jgi:2-deoxy-D-gluconate 3-dehydrogenase
VEKTGRKAWIFTADLGVQEQVANIAKDVTAAGHKVDILVNCAGIQKRHPCEEFPDNDWNDVRIPPYQCIAGHLFKAL